MRGTARRGTLKVKNGRVQKKNNWSLTPNYYSHPQPMPVVDRKRPGAGYRHVLKQADIYKFIALLPDWPELSRGLNAIVLAPGEEGFDGYHSPGVVHVCAWKADLWIEAVDTYYSAHKDIFARLGVECEEDEFGWAVCKFTEAQARGYQLLHILLHELGHHHDRMATKMQKRASRGEPYAETYALQYADAIWNSYAKAFKL